MRNLLSLIVLACFTALVSCTAGQGPTEPGIEASTGGTISLNVRFSLPAAALKRAPASDFTTGVATLVKGTVTKIAPLVILNGRASATVSQLAAGTWTLTVEFFNAAGELTHTGTATVVVANGKVVPVVVTVSATGGSIGIDITLPIDQEGPVFWNKMEGASGGLIPSEIGPAIHAGLASFIPAQFNNGAFIDVGVSGNDRLMIDADTADLIFAGLSNAGCIEFWMLTGPTFEPTWNNHFINDEGGLHSHPTIAGVSTASGPMGFQVRGTYAWTTGVVINASELHHLALSWDFSGKFGGGDTIRLFLDGNLVGATTDDANHTEGFRHYDYLFGTTWGNHGGSPVAFDNVKIWAYPKTDFSDRFAE